MTYMRRPLRSTNGRDIYDCLEDVHQITNGGVSYGDGTNRQHINGNWATVADTGLVDTEFVVNHNLGRIPVGFHIFAKDQAGDLYRSGTAWTEKQIFLKCSVAHVTNILLFIV